MRRRIIIAAVLALMLLPVGFAAFLLYTPAGLQLVAGQLWRLQRFGIRVDGVSGTLAGPLRVARLELQHPRVHVLVLDIVVDSELRGLLVQTIQTESITARDALVELRQAQTPPSKRPPRFLPQFMRIDARGIELTHVRYVHLNGTAIEAERARGRATITSRHLRVSHFQVDADRFDAAGDLLLRAGRPFGMQGNATGHVRMNGGPELALVAKVDGTFDRLAMQAQLRAPNQAAASALLTRPDGRWSIAGRVVSESFELTGWLEKPPLSLRRVALDVQANPDRIAVAGNLGIPELDRNDLTIRASGRYAARTLSIAAADLALNGTAARMQAQGTIAFDGDAPALDLSARWQNLQWPLHEEAVLASADGEGALRGRLPYDFNVTAQISGPRIPSAQGSVRGVFSRERLSVAEYAVNAFEGSLTGAATLQFAAPRAWQISTRATQINPGELHPEFAGRIDLAARAEGRGLNKNASFNLALTELKGVLRNQRVRGAARVQRDGRNWRVSNASLALGSARLSLDGTLRKAIDARWSLHAPALEKLLPQASGAIESSGSISGPLKSPHVVADLRGQNLQYHGWSAQSLTIDADVDVAGAQSSRLSIVARRLGRNAPLIDSLQLNGAGFPADHRISLDVDGFARKAQESPPHAAMQIAGRYAQQVWNATINTTQLSTGARDQQLTMAEPAHVLAARDRAELDNFCVVVGAGRMCAEGRWRRGGAWQGAVSGYEIPLASLLPPTGEQAELAGRIEGRVHAFGAAGQPWQGEAGMRIIDAAIIYRAPGEAPETLNLGTGGLAATATPQRVQFSFGIQAFTDTFVYANARVARNGSNDLLHLPLSGDLRARAADANILPLVFPEIDRAAGLLTANAAVSGTLAAPEFDGRIELANGEFDSYRVNLALRQLGFVADLKSTGLDFRGHANAGEGSLDVDGSFAWRGGVSSGRVHLRGRNLLVADLAEYRVVASPDLRFHVSGTRMDVAGDVGIPSARVQPAQLAGAVKASQDARYIGEHPAEKAGRYVVHSEIRITMGEDVRVDAFGLQGRILGAVGTTIHTGETPIGRGELSVADGRYEAYGQNLEINRGRLLFDVSPLDDPGLDIEARRRIETVTVGLNVRGTLQEPRLTFFSDPSMPQTQILAYLLTGKSMDSVARSDAATIDTARDTLAAQGGGLIASQLGRRLGIEELGVESSIDSAGQADTALVLGKFLSPRLFISYGISLTESINTVKLRYTVSDRWIFRTEAGENQSADLEYTIER